MNIGEFNIRNGRLLGSIATRTIDLPRLGLRPVESDNDRAPVFEIIALNVGNRWVQVGALWEAVAKHTTGEVFLQGSIDDPGLAEPLPIALFGSDEDGYRVAWRRPQRRDDFGPAIRSGRATQQHWEDMHARLGSRLPAAELDAAAERRKVDAFETWAPASALAGCRHRFSAEKRPGAEYAALLQPLTRVTIKGWLWCARPSAL